MPKNKQTKQTKDRKKKKRTGACMQRPDTPRSCNPLNEWQVNKQTEERKQNASPNTAEPNRQTAERTEIIHVLLNNFVYNMYTKETPLCCGNTYSISKKRRSGTRGVFWKFFIRV